jgi:hypothetical protein
MRCPYMTMGGREPQNSQAARLAQQTSKQNHNTATTDSIRLNRG